MTYAGVKSLDQPFLHVEHSKQEGGPPRLFARSRGVIVAIGVFTGLCNILLLVVPLYTIQLFDRVLSSGSFETLVVLSILALGGLVFFGVFEVLRSRLLVRLGANLELEYGQMMLQRELAGQEREADSQPVMDLRELSHYLASPSFIGLLDVPWCPIFVLIIFLINPVIGAIALAAAVLFLIIGVVTDRVTAPSLAKARAGLAVQNDIASQIRRAADVFRAMGFVPYLAARWERIVQRNLVNSINAGDRVGAWSSVARFLRLLVQVVMMAVGVSLILNREMSPGVLIACSLLLSRALAPVEQSIGALRAFSSARAAYYRLSKEIEAHANEAARMPLAEPLGAVSFNGVSLQVSGRKAPIIDDLTFEVPAGEVLAIIGPSGSGKSTVMRMLAGLQPVTAGSVRVDGTRLGDWPAQQLAERIGYLPQDVELVTGSIAENISGMDPEPNSERVLAAVRAANIEGLIQQLPQGFNTIVGAHGVALSGGQRQRVGLARALLGTRRILLLDEPDAHLDDEGQQCLMRSIATAKSQGMTVIFTSHRRTMLPVCDKVMLLVEGRLARHGDPVSVMRSVSAARESAQSGIPRPMTGTSQSYPRAAAVPPIVEPKS